MSDQGKAIPVSKRFLFSLYASIMMKEGFIYLMVIMDWYSRYMLAWEVTLFYKK